MSCGGGGGGSSRVSISADVRTMIQNIKEITGKQHSDEDVYAMLKDCSMDPDETTQKLMYQDTYHEVKSRRERRRESTNGRSPESKSTTDSQGRGARGNRHPHSNYVSSGGGRNMPVQRDKRTSTSVERVLNPMPLQMNKNSAAPCVTKASNVVQNGPSHWSNGLSAQVLDCPVYLFAWIMKELQRPTMKDLYGLLTLTVFGLCYVETATALASSATVEVYSLAKETIHARLVDMTSGSGSVDYAVLANGTVKISLERHKDYALFFSTGCHKDKEGHLKDCVTGICPESGCNVTNPPEAATTIYYKSSGFNIVTDCGFNVRIRGDFQSSDPNCYAISCNIAIKKCPISTIVKELQSPVACKAGDGVPACQYDGTAPSTYSPSAGTSCFDNAIMKFTVIPPLKE